MLVASGGPGHVPTVDQQLSEANDEELARRHLACHVPNVSLERTFGAGPATVRSGGEVMQLVPVKLAT